MVRKTTVTTGDNVHGGKGTLTFDHIVSEDELFGHGKLFAKVTFPPHSSLGIHTHTGETEPYYIISGEGEFIDHDGSRTHVKAGDVCVIEPGQHHGMENNGDVPLEIIALIYYAK